MAKQNSALTYVLDRVEPNGQSAERRPLEQSWWADLAYYAGIHHFIAADGTIRLPRSLNPRKKRYKANLIAPAVLRNISRLLGLRMDFAVAPNSPDFIDREGARIATKVWEHIRHESGFPDIQMTVCLWAAICGSGYYKVSWDPLAGTPTRVFKDPDGTIRTNLSPLEEQVYSQNGWFEDSHVGEVCIESVNPFQMHWDWKAREGQFDQANWAAQSHAASIEGLVDRYGSAIRTKVKPDESDAGAVRYEEALSTLAQGTYGLNLGQYPHNRQRDKTRVIEFWEKPQKKNNWEGRKTLVAGGYVVEDGPNPYLAFGIGLPFVAQPWWPMPGRFTGLSLVEQLRTPQKAYNDSRSHQHEVEATNGYPITYVNSAQGIKAKHLPSLPGLIVETNMSGGAPVTTNPPNLPPFIGENSNRAQGEINSIAAMATPSKDAYPAGVRSSLAINAIQEDNNMVLSPTVRMYQRATCKVGQMAIQIAQVMYDAPRMVRTVGIGGDFEVEYFAGIEIRGNHSLRTFGEPGKVETSTAFQERLMTFIEIGALDPSKPEDRVAILKAIDAKTADEVLNDQLADERQEEKMLRRIIRQPSAQLPILGFEDPHVRVKVLERYMKRDEFFQLDDQAQQAILQRWQGWTQKIQEQIEAQIALQSSVGQQASKGTPSPPKRQRSGAA